MEFRTRDALDAMYVGGVNCRIENEKITIWREDFPQPTEEQIQTKLKELEKQYADNEYQRKRLEEYPSIQELVVALYDEEDKQAIIERRNAVKAKYPKPE